MLEAVILILTINIVVLIVKIDRLRKTFLGMKYEINATIQNSYDKIKSEINPIPEAKVVRKRTRRPPITKAPTRHSPATEIASYNRSQAMRNRWKKRREREAEQRFESLANKVIPPSSQSTPENL